MLSSFFIVPVSSMMGFPLRWVFFTFCFYCRSFAELGSCCARYFREELKQRMGFPCSSTGKESALNAGDLSLIPGLGRSPGEGKRLPTPVFWPGEFHGLYSPWGLKESDMTEWLSLHLKQRIWGKSLPQEGPMNPAWLQYPFSLRYSSIFRKTGVGQEKGIIFG